jgi:tetratricopeptide (TPR) repeat protein
MFRSIVLLVGGLASLSAASLFAQDAVLGQQYGSGVHAYFMGDAEGAYERLTAAVQGGSKDPRVFYFRGLAYLRLGRPQEATMDFRKGAELESKDINRFYNVGKALERVQGSARLELENYRVDARMAALEQAEKLRKARYEAMKREEERVMREQSVAAPEMPAGGPEVVAPPAAESDNPFAAPEAAAPPEKKGAAATKPAEKKGADASSPPAEDDPFAPEKPAAKNPEKSPAPAKKKADEKKPDAKKAPAKKAPAKSPAKEPDPFDP